MVKSSVIVQTIEYPDGENESEYRLQQIAGDVNNKSLWRKK